MQHLRTLEGSSADVQHLPSTLRRIVLKCSTRWRGGSGLVLICSTPGSQRDPGGWGCAEMQHPQTYSTGGPGPSPSPVGRWPHRACVLTFGDVHV